MSVLVVGGCAWWGCALQNPSAMCPQHAAASISPPPDLPQAPKALRGGLGTSGRGAGAWGGRGDAARVPHHNHNLAWPCTGPVSPPPGWARSRRPPPRALIGQPPASFALGGVGGGGGRGVHVPWRGLGGARAPQAQRTPVARHQRGREGGRKGRGSCGSVSTLRLVWGGDARPPSTCLEGRKDDVSCKARRVGGPVACLGRAQMAGRRSPAHCPPFLPPPFSSWLGLSWRRGMERDGKGERLGLSPTPASHFVVTK